MQSCKSCSVILKIHIFRTSETHLSNMLFHFVKLNISAFIKILCIFCRNYCLFCLMNHRDFCNLLIHIVICYSRSMFSGPYKIKRGFHFAPQGFFFFCTIPSGQHFVHRLIPNVYRQSKRCTMAKVLRFAVEF